MSSSEYINNKRKDILIPGEGPTQGLEDTKLTGEVKYPINFKQSVKRFVLSLYPIIETTFFYSLTLI